MPCVSEIETQDAGCLSAEIISRWWSWAAGILFLHRHMQVSFTTLTQTSNSICSFDR